MHPDEWKVEDIESHRIGRDGYPEFLVKWEGSDEKKWEPLRHFFHQYSQPGVDYCVQQRLRVPDVLEYLHRHPPEVMIEAVKGSARDVDNFREYARNAGIDNPEESVWEDPPVEWRWTDPDTSEEDPDLDPDVRSPASQAAAPPAQRRAAVRWWRHP